MLGILDLLNSEDASEASMSQPPPPASVPNLEDLSKSGSKSPLSMSMKSEISTRSYRVSKQLPRSRVHPSLLKAKRLVDIALRHKLGSRRHLTPDQGSSKLHLKLLEAGLRVRLILSSSIHELFKLLTPHTAGRSSIVHVCFDRDEQRLVGRNITGEAKEDRNGRGRKTSTSFDGMHSTNGSSSRRFSSSTSSETGSIISSDQLSGNGTPNIAATSSNGSLPINGAYNGTNGSNGIYNGTNGSNGSLQAAPWEARLDSTSSSSLAREVSSDLARATLNSKKGDSPVSVLEDDFSNPSDLTHLLSAPNTGPRKPVLKRVRLIDNNLVNLAGVSSKVLKSFQVGKEHRLPQMPLSDDGDDRPEMVTTFNNLDTAVMSLFGIRTYSLVRVPRSSSNTSDGSVLLKLECAQPGDTRLVDDQEFMEDMVASLGKEGQTPNNLFIKKVVARPRYKSDMKIYIVPTDRKVLLYVDKRVFERDLINGVIDMDCPPDRFIYTTFPVDDILLEVKEMLQKSRVLGEPESSEAPVPNHITTTNFTPKWSMEAELLPSSLSLPLLVLNSTGSTSLGGESTPSASDRAKLSLLSIPNAKMELIEEPEDLKFDTSYMA